MTAAAEPRSGEQAEQLRRVAKRIATAIREFCGAHKRFHADELRAHVARETGVAAPASADRVMRDMRQSGEIDYRVLSRRDSLYEVVSVAGAPQ